MKVARTFGIATALLLSLVITGPAIPASADAGTQQIPLAGTGTPVTGESGPAGDALFGIEFPGSPEDQAEAAPVSVTIGRSLTRGGGKATAGTAAKKAKSNPEVNTSFEGLNFYQQRFARRGNQFSLEPPDQALCVGNGFVVEALNDVMNVFDAAGASALPDNTSSNIVSGFPRNVNHAVDLNSFYGYPPAINRTTGVRGQFITDPSCYFDAPTQRFFMVVLTLEVNPATGSFTRVNHLDLAVTQTANPTGAWNIYKVDVTNDGTHNPDPGNACPCLGDFPHVGADANGFYITTNAYPWGGNGFNGAQIYAFAKAQLAAGSASVTMQHIDTFGTVAAPSDAGLTQPGFTVWPAQSPGIASFDLNAGGTEYFLSSNAADESTRPVSGTGGPGASSQIVVWALTNTSSLNTAAPALSLTNTILPVNLYAMPPKAKQPGSGAAPTVTAPQGFCINDTTTLLSNGQRGCWRLLFRREPAHNEVVSRLDSSDTRMMQVTFANGKIWGALDTAVTIGAENRAGVAYYIVRPDVSTGTLAAKVALQGTFGMAGTDLIYPAIGVTASGRGVMALTLVGDTDNPSAAYAPIDAQVGLGDVHVVAAGAAPDDGFTSYKSQVGNPPRTRWGDYSAAAVDGTSIWIASEYIAQACDYTDWGGPSFAGGTGDNLLGTCGGASHGPGRRAALGNWSTRITKLTP